MRFAGKRVLVTGAASGIGRATALLMAREGAQVTIGDINEAGLAETAAMIGDAAHAVPYNAEDHASCRALVEAAAQDRLDVLCNVAGMLKWGPTDAFAVEDFERILRINTTSVFVLCQAALPHLLASKGNVVNIGSTSGLRGMIYTAAYCASKHAVVGMTSALAAEYAAQGVRVNAVCPGHVTTPMTQQAPPEGELDWDMVMRGMPKLVDGSCAPEDIAEAVAYLASEKARKATGTILVVDGGQLVS
ncbi:SDR family NAD(P)-dependent oxidoreductase [Altererythrobacter sp. H2]|uniref:SDR family NAD(P)-dependent oxidoreductase n=1 Tax=Altererythrobacter sp. H2 TaxID=3108391 RepID=UPI002B4BBE92|nr:SDR family NAD(P)-dependent oxidoreductase [Altererythrobacter sp. H2]WRK95195.1 SDR family NAD(P)-dependent oxidoreductase [Altererythrobacter sp. H2]